MDNLRNARLAERNIKLEISREAKEVLCTAGFDPAYGARPLKRAVKTELETPVSKLLISDKLCENDVLEVTVEEDHLHFACVSVPAEA